MARKFIADIKPGDSVEQPFLVREKHLRTQRNGAFYIDLELMDKTGSVPAKMWDATQVLFETFDEDDFILVKARSETYRRALQLVVTAIQRIEPSEVDVADFLPQTRKDIPTLLARLRKIADGIENPHLKALLAAFLGDREFAAAFQRAPAAVSMHHACLGGLLEHTVGVAELALLVAQAYPNVNRDMLVAGAVLHDIGKVQEFDYTRGFRYSDAGGLVGHLPLGVLMVERRARELEGFPGALLHQLHHLILSHHGEHEYGSPVLPATAEAVALHYIDNLDAKLSAFEQALLDDANAHTNWTEWSRIFDRKLFKGRV
jgi:3'-5' exoribonuclease